MTTSKLDLPETLGSQNSLNRIFTPDQVQANLASSEARYPEQYEFLDTTGINEKPFINAFT